MVILEYEVGWGLGETLSASLLSVRTGVSSCHEEGQCQRLHSGGYGLLLPKLRLPQTVQGVKVGEDLGLSPRSGDMEERSA